VARTLLVGERVPTATASIHCVARAFRFLPLPALLCAALPGPAHAQDTRDARPKAAGASAADRFADRPNAMVAVGGFGAPTGVLGVEYERAIARPLAVAVGTGVGAGGAQVALMVRVRRAGPTSAFGLGVGSSYGSARVPDFNLIGRQSYDDVRGAVWANIQLYYERRTSSGAVFTFASGAGQVLRARDCVHVTRAGRNLLGGYSERTERECSASEASPLLPFVSFSIGKAF
jgi:hypothetical protein